MENINRRVSSCGPSRLWGPALALLLAAATPASAIAQRGSAGWDWQFTIYGWLPTLEADTQLPSGAGGPSIEVDADTLLDNLDFTFMAALQGRKGSWGVFTDVIYLDEGATGTLQREVTIGGTRLSGDVTMDLHMDLKSWVWTLAPTYTLSETDRHVTDSFFGFRMLDIDSEFDWTFNGDIAGLPLPGRNGRVVSSGTNWDAVIGVKGHTLLGSDGRWILPYHLDIGAGDSDVTWQAMAGLGYQFNWGTAVLTYRYLDYDLDSGGTLSELTFGGPMIGASFSW